MKAFKVGFYYEENGTVMVKASSKEEAEAKVYKKLEDDGLNGVEEEWGTDITHREYNTTGVYND